MIKRQLVAGIIGAILIMNNGQLSADEASKMLKYPEPPRTNTVDHYHGTEVSDPHRPLEDPDAPTTREWVASENKITFGFLEQIPERTAIRRRLTELWDYEKYGVPWLEGGQFFFTRNTGLQNQSILYTAESLDGPPRPLLDPNTLSADGTVAVAGTVVSEDGKHLAYGIAAAGSDWSIWKVRDVATGNDLPDELKWIKFSGVEWNPNGQGFYYGRFPEPKPGDDLKGANYHQKVFYHRLATPQTDDRLVWEDAKHKEWRAIPYVTDDGKYLILTIEKGTDDKHRVLYRPLDRPEVEPAHLVGDFDAEYSVIDSDGPIFWFKTNKNAPRGKVIAIDTRQPQPERWIELIPEAAETLEGVDVVGDHFLARYLKDAHTLVRVFDLRGRQVRDVELPGLGTASGFAGRRKYRETFYLYTSFTMPSTIYRYDIASGRLKLGLASSPSSGLNVRASTKAFVQGLLLASKVGTKVPMASGRQSQKGLKRDGSNPTLLYGYGGFNISLTPSFSPSVLAWMEMGGLYALPNLRGGGEYGEEWHQGGTKLKKQNVFDDFIAAAEWLIANQYTTTPRLAISGGSNGGLLVGACLTQRPDLFGAALPAVGVMDMLRFHKFTIGWAWIDDYGSSDHADQFKILYAYSSLHNIKRGTCYPPTLITTADDDDRVVSAHSLKFAAALQAAQSCDNPVLIRIETKAGHGAGKPTTKLIEEATDKWAFLVKVLGIRSGAASR